MILSNQTAFALCDSLLQMTRFWIIELPEPELREIRNALGSLLVRTDQVLDLMESEICLDFASLRVDQSELLPYDSSSSNFFPFQILVTLLQLETLMPSLFQAPPRRTLVMLLSRISVSKNTPTQMPASQTPSCWISVHFTPLFHLITQVPPTKSQCLLQLYLCPPLPRRPRFVPQPQNKNQSQSQHKPRRSLTAIIC